MLGFRFSGAVVLTLAAVTGFAQDSELTQRDTSRGDVMIAAYFKAETEKLAKRSLSNIKTKEDWEKARPEQQRQLLEMLGLDPLPDKTPLQAKVTGTVDHEDFIVEKLHFQSRPGLYVTGNLYRPKRVTKKLPAILYVCGHGKVKKNGVSYGNKTHYHHHGSWFARNGYVCLTIDTLQLGEIEGIHHGTYRYGRFWWNSRGYSPASVEAWNCVRALDYLETRPEVDAERMGVTGRSGGGAYSWWIAAIDERIKAAVPVAGITSMKNHVVDGTIEGHCDCMFMVNTYGWDFAQVAALVAPRPLLISNSDKDPIFPLDGVVDVYVKTKRIYDLYDDPRGIGLQITEGPHSDTQELRIHAFHWFNKHLKGDDPLIETAAVKFFQPEQLKVFDALPEEETNTTIDERFVDIAKLPDLEADPGEKLVGNCLLAGLRMKLFKKSFRGWPTSKLTAALAEVSLKESINLTHDGVRLRSFDFLSQEHIPLTLYVLQGEENGSADIELSVLNVLDETGWSEFLSTVRVGFNGAFQKEVSTRVDQDSWNATAGMLKSQRWAMGYICPRGIGPTAWNQSERKQTHHRRRFALLGQTLDGMRLWDVLRGHRAFKQVLDSERRQRHWVQAKGDVSGLGLYAAMYDWSIERVDLYDLPASHRGGPEFLNVMRLTDIPNTVAQVSYRTKVVIYDNDKGRWTFPLKVAATQKLLKGSVSIRPVPQ